MPESFPSIGEAIAYAMDHNIRLVHGPQRPPAQAVNEATPKPSPYSLPGMLDRLTEDVSPAEVAQIIDDLAAPLIGALPQVTELVAAAADWAHARLSLDGPHRDLTFEVWTHLAACTGLLKGARQELETVALAIAECPTELSDPEQYKDFVLRLREFPPDTIDRAHTPIPAAPAVQEAGVASAPSADADRSRMARATSPHAAAHDIRSASGGQPPASPPAPPARPPRTR